VRTRHPPGIVIRIVLRESTHDELCPDGASATKDFEVH
jgi:hypothetical protein